jgi:hypothetical protein
MSDIIVDLDTITTRYNVHKTTIGEWVKKYPEMKKDKNKYDLVECDYAYIQILEERLENMGSASKLKEAQTENFILKNQLLKMEINIKEGKYLDYETMAKKVNKLLAIKRLELQEIPLSLGIESKNKEAYRNMQNLIDEITERFFINCYDLEVSGNYDLEENTDDKILKLCYTLGLLINKMYSEVLENPQSAENVQTFNSLIKEIMNDYGL